MTANDRPLLVQFGAGNIGRSLVGSLFSAAGYDVLFVDAARDIVRALQRRRAYRVVIKDDLPPGAPAVIDVAPVDALEACDAQGVAEAVARASLIGTAVGAGALPLALAALAPGLQRRAAPVSILLCENLHNAPALARTVLARHLPAEFDLSGRVGLVATSIGKMVPLLPREVRARDPLEVWGEAYNTIIADAQAFVGPVPRVPGLEPKANFTAYVERKLYIHNLGHAVCACHGFLHGCRLIADAMDLPAVAGAARRAMEASARALIVRYPGEFNAENLAAHIDDLLRRFRNRALGDTVFRVGRDLPRKLAPDDRFIGALRLVAATGGDTRPVCEGIAAALHFAAADDQGQRFPADDEVRARVAAAGVTAFLVSHAGLDPGLHAEHLGAIESAFRRLAAKR